MLNRRHFIQAMASAGALIGGTGLASATQAQGKKFLFVIADGGWDPLCVFAPLFDAAVIDMELDAQPMSIGGFQLVDHPERPAVRRFFETWGTETMVINGISTRSISHGVCSEIAMTGSSSGTAADWPTLIALDKQEQYPMPSLVFNAPIFAGNHEVVVARTGEENQLQSILEGYYIGDYAPFVEPMPPAARGLLDRFVRQKAQTLDAHFARRGGEKLLRDFNQSHEQVRLLKSIEDFSLTTEEGGFQIESAIRALSMGLSRCVTLTDGRDWDTHEDNTPQNPQFESLFSDLSALLSRMASTPGTQGATLLDETVVVVMSEMGRTPKLNDTGGRDHWPFTSAMVIGNTITGGRSIGAYSEYFTGVGFDLVTGELQPESVGISAADFGATLLALADIDPASALPSARSFAEIFR